MLDLCAQLPCTAYYTCHLTCGYSSCCIFLAGAHDHLSLVSFTIFIGKFSPLPGFEPGTSRVPSRYATNWAILSYHKYTCESIYIIFNNLPWITMLNFLCSNWLDSNKSCLKRVSNPILLTSSLIPPSYQTSAQFFPRKCPI